MDESHFEDGGARAFKYSFFFVLALITFLGVWKKDAILGYLSFREHGESRIVVYALSGTSVSVLDEKRNKRELGLVGRDGKFTLVEQGEIESLRIYLFHPYFFPEEKLFERVEKGETVTFSAAMAPMFGSLKVRSFGRGARRPGGQDSGAVLALQRAGRRWSPAPRRWQGRHLTAVPSDGLVPRFGSPRRWTALSLEDAPQARCAPRIRQPVRS